jgi:hypothetical protein
LSNRIFRLQGQAKAQLSLSLHAINVTRPDFLFPLRAIAIWRRFRFPKVCPSRVRRLTVEIADIGVRPLAGHIEPSKATCRIRPTIDANLTVTPPIFGPSDSANRSASANAYLPPKYPGCRDVTQDFAQSVSGQHGQPKYLSRRAVVIGKPTKESRKHELNNAWNAT